MTPRLLSLTRCRRLLRWAVPFLALFPPATVLNTRSELLAGAVAVDVTPEHLPIVINGGVLSQTSDRIKTRLHARVLVLGSGATRIALGVVDSCMMGRPLLDETKAKAAAQTGIPADRMMISATHTHSAPAVMSCLGTDADPRYTDFLRDRIVEAIRLAQEHLEPARIGFARADAASFTAPRQWIRRPDRLATDPFGNLSVRANMHAGSNWDDVTGEAGPEDPDLSLISIQTTAGRPIAVIGNFSMHYFQDQPVSADYYGLFSEGLRQRIAPNPVEGKPPFVGLLSHGCSGDIWRRDYTKPASEWNVALTIEEYTQGLLDIALKAYEGIEYQDNVALAMTEQRMTLKYRVPDKQRLEWAQRIVQAMAGREPRTNVEVYAREQIHLHDQQQTEIVVQALKLGDIAIVALPTETYAITGLKIKAASPVAHTVVIELANGGDGYIPPPEQHPLGGYNTWAARSAGLEVMAEPKIAGAAIRLLEALAGQPRREHRLPMGTAAHAILDLKPVAWWRLDEFSGPFAQDTSGHQHPAFYESGITFYLEGPDSARFCGAGGPRNRAAHFAGGRLRAGLNLPGDHYSALLWIWNGMPSQGRNVSGWFFSLSPDQCLSDWGDHFGIGGNSGHAGRLIFLHGNSDTTRTLTAGATEIPRWKWCQVALTREGATVKAYLDGRLEFEVNAPAKYPAGFDPCFFGGRSDNENNWEGRIDEVAVFDRALSADEVARLRP